MGALTKHGVKQVDRLLSNRGINVLIFFAHWTPYLIGARTEVVVALDWTSFAADQQETIVLSMLTGHGRATPLLWKTVASSTSPAPVTDPAGGTPPADDHTAGGPLPCPPPAH